MKKDIAKGLITLVMPGMLYVVPVQGADGVSYGVGEEGVYSVDYGNISTLLFNTQVGVWYGATDGANKDEFFATTDAALYRINPKLESVVKVGDFGGGVSVKELAYNEDTSILYGTDYMNLYTIDATKNAALALVGPLLDNSASVNGFWAMDYHDGLDKLFAVSESTQIFYEVSMTDGSLTPIGNTNTDRITDIWYDSSSGNLYGISNFNERHYLIDPVTGNATELFDFGSGNSILGLGDIGFDDNKCAGKPMDVTGIILTRAGANNDQAQIKLKKVTGIKAAAEAAVAQGKPVTFKIGSCGTPIGVVTAPNTDLNLTYLNLRYTVGNLDMLRCVFNTEECVLNLKGIDFDTTVLPGVLGSDVIVTLEVGDTVYVDSIPGGWKEFDSGATGNWTKYRKD